MTKIQRLMTNICSQNLNESKQFYTQLFDFNIGFESDWFIHLISKYDGSKFELGIIKQDYDIVPEGARLKPQGMYITFVVPDADQVYATAMKHHLKVISEPENTFYGQRRLLLEDPDGVIVDVSSVIV